MLVIDPTDEGMQMAKAIVRITQGQLEPVMSDDEMLAAQERAADALKHAGARVRPAQFEALKHSLEIWSTSTTHICRSRACSGPT